MHKHTETDWLFVSLSVIYTEEHESLQTHPMLARTLEWSLDLYVQCYPSDWYLTALIPTAG